jgi:hypothetical protein
MMLRCALRRQHNMPPTTILGTFMQGDQSIPLERSQVVPTEERCMTSAAASSAIVGGSSSEVRAESAW